jgi:molybdate transport system substrate-binding protein
MKGGTFGRGSLGARLAAWLAVLACGAFLVTAPARAQAREEEIEKSLFVAAASSLHDALQFMARAFQRKALAEVTRTYGGSGNLRRQIEAGAPVDVFLTAQPSMLEEMTKDGRITESRLFATNSLVLIVPATARTAPRSLADLVSPEFRRIGIGQPDYVPAGEYTRNALKEAGLWDELEKRFVYGEDVRQVLAYAGRGEVDAAFVYRTDARGSKTVRVAVDVPPVPGHPIAYAAGITSQAMDPALARAFLDFLVSREGQSILAQYGFGPAPAAAPATPAAAAPAPPAPAPAAAPTPASPAPAAPAEPEKK